MTKITPKKIISYLAFMLVGACVGYFMYSIMGCPDGTCPLRSSPVNSMLYGMGSGLLIGIIYNSD